MGSADTGIVLLGETLQKMGFTVAGHPRFVVAGDDGRTGHDADGYHPKGQAIDVNWPNAAAEKDLLDDLYAQLKRGQFGIVELLWQVTDHYDHLHVAIVGPPTKALQEFAEKGGVAPKDVAGAAVGAAGEVASFAGDQALKIAKGILDLLWGALGEDGARILLYIAFVLGGTTLAYFGFGRMLGIRAPAQSAAQVAA